MEIQYFEAGTVIMKPGDEIEEILFLYSGELEVFTTMSGNDKEEDEFIIDKLYSGSIINYRCFFQKDDHMSVSLRCASNCRIYVLTRDMLQYVLEGSTRSCINSSLHEI